MNINNTMPYSYHTFMYPFYWTTGSMQPDNIKWERTPFRDNVREDSAEDLLTYATWQYFSPKARRLIFDWEKGAICCYHFAGVNTENSFLHLWLDGDLDSPVLYRLRVNQIRLELLPNLRIGVLILEAENYGETADAEKKIRADALSGCSPKERLDEITKINDLGRRVFSPYLVRLDDGSLQKGGEAPWKAVLEINKNCVTLVDCTHIDGRIEQIQDGFVRLIQGQAKEEMKLYPAIDDRMFVTCCLGVKEYEPFSLTDSGMYEYQSDIRSAEKLYKLIFLERGESSNCRNREMMRSKLQEHVYARWIEKGTVHGITEYSMVCVTGCDDEGRLCDGLKATVINPFLTEYVEMAKIAVLQRAAVIRLEDKASEISRELDDKVEDIRGLWKEYLRFQSELLLSEVTFQEQGTEIYDILKKSLRIADLSTSLNTNMYNLHEMAEFEDAKLRREHDEEESKSDNRLSRAVNLFSVMGISITLAGLIQDALAYTEIGSIKQNPVRTSLSIAVLIIELFVLYIFNQRWLKKINERNARRNFDSEDKDDFELMEYYKVNRKIWICTGIAVVAAVVIMTLVLVS